MTDDKKRFITNGAVDKAEENVQDVIVARDRPGRRGAAHPRQVRVQAPKARHGAEYRFKSAGDLSVIRTSPVQSENRRAAAVLGVMHRQFVDRSFHPDSVEGASILLHHHDTPEDDRLRELWSPLTGPAMASPNAPYLRSAPSPAMSASSPRLNATSAGRSCSCAAKLRTAAVKLGVASAMEPESKMSAGAVTS